MSEASNFSARLATLPAGFSEVSYQGRRWGMTITGEPAGRRVNLVARELGGQGYVSFNYYRLTTGARLKPCEMPAQHVIDFVLGLEAGDENCSV